MSEAIGLFLIFATVTGMFFAWVHGLQVGEYQPWPVSLVKAAGIALLMLGGLSLFGLGVFLVGGQTP